ncbi:hypothetical protein DV515_00017060 [Chloebia gouldiae]|uniref:Peptidase A2 domain-containing protein n=1 Tax=Chloebia gouldiae TaxID=44316 RepID=A0A3L8R9J1_CHLGU|nr:hypothetical protein DV515_00017055 [Chloebia gouldiae]RLV76357.1 hypothetical protein DV515_00017057 [Chloebia gouldiae]RLV76358.1 hypothetical protein DV515_00017062 [Chloebia gouldiae]RLV76359.1 hypothetical protein DV515_00017060 [Chloebia gouldiae]
MYSTTSLVGGLLLGRSSTSKQGVVVIPSIIDVDFTGRVKIMRHAFQPPVTIPKGRKIAQIVAIENFLPHCQRPKEPTDSKRQDNGFGSTGQDVFFTINLKDRPYKKAQLQRGSHCVRLEPMLDTGADVSIIHQMYWPSNWPLRAPSSHIVGVGGMKIPSVSRDPISIIFEDNQKLTLHANISTLHDAQRLFGDLQWVRTTVGITNDDFQPFLPWLQGSDANSHRVCTPEQQEALIQVSEKLQCGSIVRFHRSGAQQTTKRSDVAFRQSLPVVGKTLLFIETSGRKDSLY